MSQYAREHPDEPPLHDAFDGQRITRKRSATVAIGRYGRFLVLPEIPVNGTTNIRAFEHAQDAADWVENNLPGQVIAWEVRP